MFQSIAPRNHALRNGSMPAIEFLTHGSGTMLHYCRWQCFQQGFTVFARHVDLVRLSDKIVKYA
jgi:hypothetical protein